MPPSPNSSPPFIVIGNHGNRRVAHFQQALARRGHPPALLVSYEELTAGRAHLAEVIQPGAVVRIESPERSFPVEQAILALGAEVPDEDGDYARASAEEVARLVFDKGAIVYPRQWYLGYCRLLALIGRQLRESAPHRSMSHPDDIATMFDKPRTHARLAAAGVPVPRGLGKVRSYDELVMLMRETGCGRVFVKLAHGSSASGVVAYQVSGDRHMATTTVEMARAAGGLRLYNSRRLFVYRDPVETATLIDALCRHRVHVEQWFPKAGLHGRTFDLRVVVIRGEARHVVVRLSRTALTNLHLDNDRAGLELLAARLDPAIWEAARAACERAMALFPSSLYAGIDLLIGSSYRRYAIAEVNAFGDLLLDVTHKGEDTYEAEIEAMLGEA